MAEMVEQIGDQPAEILPLRRELLDLDEHAGRVPVDDRVAEPEERLLLDRTDELEDVLCGDLPVVADASWSSVETASRNEPWALRAISASAAFCASIVSPSQTRRSSVTSSAKRGRWNMNVWQRERTVGSTLARSVVQKTNTR